MTKRDLHLSIKGLIDTLRFILSHPLNRQARLSAVRRYLAWQVGSRIVPGPVAVPFVNEARLLVRPGMLGATRNIYGGIEEFEEMSFLLHLLRAGELFVDVGANVGAYTVLASRAVGARSIAFEPAPVVFGHLLSNIALNGIGERVVARNTAAGRAPGRVGFTRGLDVMDHVVASRTPSPSAQMEVPVETLDGVLLGKNPRLIKIDVEGYEHEVIAGATAALGADGLLAVIMELNDSGERYGFHDRDLRRVMESRGFTPYRYAPFERALFPIMMEDRKSRNAIFLRSPGTVIERLKSAPPFRVRGIGI